jgi:hypothetical protein
MFGSCRVTINVYYSRLLRQPLGIFHESVFYRTPKTAQRRLWGDNPRWSTTWYEPYKDQKSIDLAIHWVLSNPGVFINSAGDVNVMPMVMDAASRYKKPPTDKQMQELMRTQAAEPLWV